MNITSNGKGYPKMSSVKPYLMKPLYHWIIDNKLTPYLVVNAYLEKVSVPLKFVQDDGKIILDISPKAVNGLHISSEHIEFEAKFQGSQEFIFVPFQAVLALYTQENGRGMSFDDSDELLIEKKPTKLFNVKLNDTVRGHLRLVSEKSDAD